MGRYQEYEPGGVDPPISSPDQGGPIGVPADYPIHRPFTPLNRLPKAEQHVGNPMTAPGFYMDGDEFIPSGYTADRIAQIQVNMEKAGILSQNYSLGIWDQPTQSAYKYLLGAANGAGESAEQTLSRMLATVAAGGGPDISDSLPPLVIRQSDPQTLGNIFRRAVIDLAGVGWTQAQIQSAVTAYQALEAQRQSEMYSAQYLQGGGTVQELPSPEEFIENKVRTEQPEAVAGEEGLGFIQEFVNMATGRG